MSKKVTILGAGNGGHALGMHLALKGIDVMMFEHPRFEKNLEGIQQNQGIEAIEKMLKGDVLITSKLKGFGKIKNTTTDPEKAMDFADIVFMIVPAFAQETIFRLVMPYLKDGCLLVLLPGNFGSLVFHKILENAGIKKDVTFAEANTIPHACRIVGPGQVFVGGVKDAFDIAAMPAARTPNVVDRLRKVLPLRPVALKNVLETGFSNMNMIAHVPTSVLNMGLAESRQGQFYFYKEGMSESVARVQQKVDDERLSIGRKYHLQLRSFVEEVNLLYSQHFHSIRDFAVNTPVHNSFGYDFPKSPRERYVSEDCPFLLTPLYEFGKLAGMETPAIKSIITVASIMNEVNYFETGRTLERMGLTGWKLERVEEWLQKGPKMTT